MPQIPRYQISTRAPLPPEDHSAAETAAAAAEFSTHVAKRAKGLAEEIGAPAARDLGEKEGASLDWKPKGGIGPIAEAYDEAARRANDVEVESQFRQVANLTENQLKGRVDGYKLFPETYAENTKPLISTMSPDRRFVGEAARRRIGTQSVMRLTDDSFDAALEHTGASIVAQLNTLAIEQANLTGSDDPVDQARLKDVRAQVNELQYFGIGQPVNEDGSQAAVDVALADTTGKIKYKTRALVPVASIVKYRENLASDTAKSELLKRFDAADLAGHGSEFIASFREEIAKVDKQGNRVSFDERIELEHHMISVMRSRRTQERQANKEYDKGLKADFEAKVSTARSDMMNPETAGGHVVSVAEYNELKKEAWRSPNAFDELTTTWNTYHGGVMDDEESVNAIREKLRLHSVDEAEALLQTGRINNKVSAKTSGQIEAEIKTVRTDVENGPLKDPSVATVVNNTEARIRYRVLGVSRVRGGNTVPAVIIAEFNNRVHNELVGLPPHEWADRANKIANETINSVPPRELVAAVGALRGDKPGEEKYEPSMLLPPFGIDYVKSDGKSGVTFFDAPRYIEQQQKVFDRGQMKPDEFNARAAAAIRWENLQKQNDGMGAMIDSSKKGVRYDAEQARTLQAEREAIAKYGGPPQRGNE